MADSDQESFACNKRLVALGEIRREKIQLLNDELRTSLRGGRIMITRGVQKLGSAGLLEVLTAVRQHDCFDPDNDSHGEHDFGSFSWNSHKLFWKIDYYDLALECGSPDPADPAVTTRVLTIMLASEY